MEKYHIPWTCLPKLTWGLPTWSLTTNSSWLPWGGCRASDASTNYFYFRNKSITELDGETEEREREQVLSVAYNYRKIATATTTLIFSGHFPGQPW